MSSSPVARIVSKRGNSRYSLSCLNTISDSSVHSNLLFFLRILKNGKHLFADLEMNLLRAARALHRPGPSPNSKSPSPAQSEAHGPLTLTEPREESWSPSPALAGFGLFGLWIFSGLSGFGLFRAFLDFVGLFFNFSSFFGLFGLWPHFNFF